MNGNTAGITVAEDVITLLDITVIQVEPVQNVVALNIELSEPGPPEGTHE